jgi:hypothetical protein
MSFMHIAAVDARNAELRRVADLDRRSRAPRLVHPVAAPEPPPPRARRALRTVAAAAVTRVAR